MPPRKGSIQHNISLPEELSRQLATLAATPDYNGSKSEVVEQALRVLFEGAISETVIAGLQQRLSLMLSFSEVGCSHFRSRLQLSFSKVAFINSVVFPPY